ncbi:hypothetical protein [Ekhidna sp.]|uniref:hypothetical protein n=1 Tax=Ekhidna sp. TaxID=2608089 RepID=UPI003B5929CF
MKKKIVIASVLKPIDDVRAFWKLSQSIAKTNKYEVNIIGNDTKKEPYFENVNFHAHRILRTQWIKRWIVRLKILFKIISLKPSILIITTHELIIIAFLSKMITGCKVVYDVQENHFLNLTNINPTPIKRIYAWMIRAKEVASQLFISTYWLAEKCYRDQLHFVKGKNTVIENKAFKSKPSTGMNKEIVVLFSGTISEYGGVSKAISFYKKLLKLKPDSTLKIIGQIHDSRIEKMLVKEAEIFPGIELYISYEPIPHPEILKAISQATIGVIGYQPSKVNKEKIPTKLYEYSRYRLPYLVEKDTLWSKAGADLGGAIPVDFDSINLENVYEKIKNPKKLFTNEYPLEAIWEEESVKIFTSLDKLISGH